MKKFTFIFSTFLLLLGIISNAQAPTLIYSKTFSAIGSGASGVPTINVDIPAGKDRMMIVHFLFERNHSPVSTNWVWGASGSDGLGGNTDVYVGNKLMDVRSNRIYRLLESLSAGPERTLFSLRQAVRVLGDSDGLPVGNTTITIPGLNLPKLDSDEVGVIVTVFNNVKTFAPESSLELQYASNTQFSGTNVVTVTANHVAVPAGRSISDITYVGVSGISQQVALSYSSGWTSSADLAIVVNNTSGPTNGTSYNEPDGVSARIAYRNYSSTSTNPSYTLTKANNTQIYRGYGYMYALIPFAKPSVSGTVYSDTDGVTNINGTGTNAGGLYVNVIDADNKLIHSAIVASNGEFTTPIGILNENHNYRLELSKNTGTVGDNAPAKELPSDWTTVGESTSATGNDGTADGIINLIMSDTNVSGLRFGIFKPFKNSCTTGCNNNTFLNASDPNTIEYDNMVGLYHSTLVKEADGTVKVWGVSSAPNGTSHNTAPVVVAPTTYNYKGDILKMTGAATSGSSAQYAILTTDGLYYWGTSGILVNSSVKSGTNFSKTNSIGTYGQTETNAYGLPKGVVPEDVKMLFGTFQTLAIVTCTGEAWVMSNNSDMFGDGVTSTSGANRYIWHRVSTASNTPLENVVAVRGAGSGLIALTAEGKVYTWGLVTYLGNSTASSSRNYATEMNLSALDLSSTNRVKMIQMTSNSSYLILTTQGEVWGLGENSNRELGINNTTDQNNWQRVSLQTAGVYDKIVWISSNEHSASGRNGYGANNAMTINGKLWAWGHNSYNMLGESVSPLSPTIQPGNLSTEDRIIAVETGGHTTMVIRQCSKKYGYVGHKINGSMGDGTTSEGYVNKFNFSDTAEVTVCGAATTPMVDHEVLICFSTDQTNLNDAVSSTLPNGFTLEWWTTPNRQAGTKITNPIVVGVGTYYAFYIPIEGACSNPDSSKVEIKYNSSDFCYCTKPPTTGTPAGYTKVGITVQQKQAAWPENIPNGWIALESKEKGMVITRVQNSDAVSEAKEGMLIYDIDAQCVKLYNGSTWKCIEKSCNE